MKFLQTGLVISVTLWMSVTAVAKPSSRPIATTKPTTRPTQRKAVAKVKHQFVTNRPMTIQGNVAFADRKDRTRAYYRLQELVPRRLVTLQLMHKGILEIYVYTGGKKEKRLGSWMKQKKKFTLKGALWSKKSTSTPCTLHGSLLFCNLPEKRDPTLHIHYFSKTF